MSVPGPSVVLAVLTYRRPEDLRDALPELVAQADRVPGRSEVLVVDNDPAGGAGAQVTSFARALGDGAPVVRYAHEPTPGIAAARNRALDEAGDHDLLVFIDDDERPVAHWLEELLATYAVDRPAAVVGPVVSRYEVEPEPWIQAGRFFDRRRLPSGTALDVAATNNLLLDLAQVRALDLRFDERFGITGGSDTLFTRQLVDRGGRMVWCDEAVVWDIVPASRLTRSWVLRRAFRSGNGHSRVALERTTGLARTLARARLTLDGAVRVVGGAARWLVGLATGSLGRRARGRRTIARGAGMVSGAYGYVYAEYRRAPEPAGA
jgi:succinoglycan biosynthesis protein ExoM